MFIQSDEWMAWNYCSRLKASKSVSSSWQGVTCFKRIALFIVVFTNCHMLSLTAETSFWILGLCSCILWSLFHGWSHQKHWCVFVVELIKNVTSLNVKYLTVRSELSGMYTGQLLVTSFGTWFFVFIFSHHILMDQWSSFSCLCIFIAFQCAQSSPLCMQLDGPCLRMLAFCHTAHMMCQQYYIYIFFGVQSVCSEISVTGSYYKLSCFC